VEGGKQHCVPTRKSGGAHMATLPPWFCADPRSMFEKYFNTSVAWFCLGMDLETAGSHCQSQHLLLRILSTGKWWIL